MRPISTKLRGALNAAGVELLSVLIETGDVTDPDHHERDRDWIGGWIDTGRSWAPDAPVSRGKTPYSEAGMARSKAALRELAKEARRKACA